MDKCKLKRMNLYVFLVQTKMKLFVLTSLLCTLTADKELVFFCYLNTKLGA